MSEGQANREPAHFVPSEFPLLFLLFFGSGCAALIYELVWFQMLQLVIGSSALSLGVLLATFMGGMCLGSLGVPRLVPATRHPLRCFALIETGIGALGILVLFLVPLVARVYVAAVGVGAPGLLLRAVLCAVCLLPPTILMGATLPVISRWVGAQPQTGFWLGFLYAGNLAGAVFGSLWAGFYLVRIYDMPRASYVAVSVNALVAITAFAISRAKPVGEVPSSESNAAQLQPTLWPVHLTIGISGLCALSAEVVWTRLLSLMLGATVYTFSIILAVFLVGLGIGGGLGSWLARVFPRPRVTLGICQLMLVPSIAISAHLLAKSLPYWPINPSLAKSIWFNFQLDLLRCAWALLLPAIFWGASFPLALAAAVPPGKEPARWVGRLYASNTFGAIIGALASSLLLIPEFGTQQTQRLIMTLSGLAGLLAIFVASPSSAKDSSSCGSPSSSSSSSSPSSSSSSSFSSSPPKPENPPANFFPGRSWARISLSGAIALVVLFWVFLLVKDVPIVPWDLVAYGRYLPTKTELGTNLFMGEGMNASVAVVELADGTRNFHVSGKIEASTDPQDMRLQRMLGHLPALIHPQPRSVLIVGCGAGVTAGSFTTYPDVQQITICEIEPLIPKAVARFFAPENYNVVQKPNVKIVYDDARHFVLTTPQKFDIITSDPIHPWVNGAATLYTKEYFETCKQHLNPGGLVTQWVPLYESNPAAVKSEIATFFDVFPDGTVWSNDQDGQGYDLVLLGQAGPLQIDLGRIQRRLNDNAWQPALQSLKNVGFKSAFSLLTTYAGQASDLKPWLRGAEINRDRNLRLQYLAGMGLNLYQPDAIYSDMLYYRRFHKELFTGADEWNEALKFALDRQRRETH